MDDNDLKHNIALVPFSQHVFRAVSHPLMAHLPKGATMIATQVASPLLTPIKTSFYVAIMLAMPVVIYQIWAFVAPGLYRREKRLAVPVLISSVILFYVGVCFAYFAIFPVMFGFLASTAPEGVVVMTDISSYLDFVLALFLAFGVAFEVPVATVLLVLTGIVAVDTLKGIRSYVFLGAFVVGMVLTPPDPFSQTLLAIPLYLLYEAGIVMSRILSTPAAANEPVRD
ncbi:MAG: twin-arginine translocase subunit TatC [Gammaproteobacteria bacterium PRO9]|nr:twin-arginine translocase subunit TatC [Gammaproteobacteria bacterium PRO9]